MAKRNRRIDQEKIDLWLQEGRGQGQGVTYKPWLTIQDVASMGLATRVMRCKIRRIYHLMSKLERSFFYLFDWAPSIIDIREQFPLLPLDETIAIAEECGVSHPPKSKEPMVMTTDFLLTVATPQGSIDYAIAIKPATKLSQPRVLEKLEIERHYWQSRNVDWRILTDRELPHVVPNNIAFLRGYFDLGQRLPLSADELQKSIAILDQQMIASVRSLQGLTAECDVKLDLAPGTFLTIVYHLIATHYWHIDLISFRYSDSALIASRRKG